MLSMVAAAAYSPTSNIPRAQSGWGEPERDNCGESFDGFSRQSVLVSGPVSGRRVWSRMSERLMHEALQPAAGAGLESGSGQLQLTYGGVLGKS